MQEGKEQPLSIIHLHIIQPFQRGVQCGVQRLEAMTSSDFSNSLEISASAY